MKALPSLLVLLACVALASPALAGSDGRVSFGSPVTVAAGEVVDGDVVVFGADAHVDGEVLGDVVVFGGNLSLGPEAVVYGDAVNVLGKSASEATSRILGEHVALDNPDPRALRGQLAVDAGSRRATVPPLPAVPPKQPTTRSREESGRVALLGGAMTWSAGSAFLLVVGLLFLSTWPDRSRNIRRTIEAAPGLAFVVGGLVSAGIALVLMLLAIILVGLLAWPFVGTFALALWLAGLTGFCEAIGDRFPGAARSRAATFAIGCLIFCGLAGVALGGGLWTALSLALILAVGSLSVGAAILSRLGGQPFGF